MFWEYIFGVFVLFGFNFIFWFAVGGLRLLDDVLFRKHPVKYFDVSRGKKKQKQFLKPRQVAVIIPAYNEELVIADTIKSLLPIVLRKNIFVNTYGSSDRTAEIATRYKVNVLNDKTAGKTKAEKLSNTVKILNEKYNYKAVLFVDADTRISRDFLVRGLPYFSDPDVVAVAGYATTLWDRKNASFWSMFYVSYRERMYFFMQVIVKYAQTWRNTNVSPIIPGFASIYRMDILPQIDINPKGLVIEDFNMTFEVHHKKLGKIAHHRSVFATTQDPDNFKDYVQQISRWDLGFWQTVRRHGFWASAFSASLIFYIIDVMFGSIVFIFLPLIFFVGFTPILIPSILHITWFLSMYNFIHSIINVKAIFIGVFIIDYTMTFIVAFAQKRVEYFLFGFGFLFLRYVDSLLYVLMLPKAYLVTSTGRWKSPTRR
jgi:cellulose synthase/poly-beta-1,6-N-acetylglucosamine synthase-like glycosyltransferase